MSSKVTGPILITGGTGQLGSRIAALMRSESVPHLVAARSATGPEGVKFDYTDRETWNNPFEKAAPSTIPAVFLLALPTTVSVELMNEFVDFAIEKGVKRFVLLSASIVEMGGPVYGKVHTYLKELGDGGLVEWAVLRPTWFMSRVSLMLTRLGDWALKVLLDNFAEQPHHVKAIKDEGKIYSATGDGRIPWVSADDIAACAVQTLTIPQPPNTDYFILGPELLTYSDVSALNTVLVQYVFLYCRTMRSATDKE